LWLENKSTGEVVKSFVTDISNYPNRYNRFNVSLALIEGQYLYKFYQKASNSNTDTDGERVLEYGLLKVIKDEETTIYYTP
jgi:hypothetical protein